MYKHTFSGLRYSSNIHGSQEGRSMTFWVDYHIIYYSNHDTSDSGSGALEKMTQAGRTCVSSMANLLMEERKGEGGKNERSKEREKRSIYVIIILQVFV